MIFLTAFVVLFCIMALRATFPKTTTDWFGRVLGVAFLCALLVMLGCVFVACVKAMP